MRQVILGICAFNHDSAAALVVDNQLVGFLEEERVNEQKNTSALPRRSAAILLQEQGLGTADVTDIAFYFDPRRIARSYLLNNNPLAWAADFRRLTSGRFVYEFAWAAEFCLRSRRIPAMLDATKARMHYIPHHDCHIWYAVHASRQREGVVISNDSIGEDISSIAVRWTTSDSGAVAWEPVFSQCSPHSIGYLYGAVSERLGFNRQDGAGKVMALASFCELRDASYFTDRIELQPDGRFRFRAGLVRDRSYKPAAQRLHPDLARRYPVSRDRDATHYDLAFGVQKAAETIIAHQVSVCAPLGRTIALTGGVAQNSVANGMLTATFPENAIFVPPVPHDAGCAIGAALACAHKYNHVLPDYADAAFLGTRYSDRQVSDYLTSRSISFTEHSSRDDCRDKVTGLLLKGRTIGLFRGPMEGGPRALGNRSIIALPEVEGITNHLNANVKYREPFRPYGVIVPENDLATYFEVPPSVRSVPYMTHVFTLRESYRAILGSATHIDKTFRVQTADPADRLLLGVFDALARQGHCRMVINTSMNVMGKPISRTIDHALSCFYTSGLDVLVLNERYVVCK